jgi:protein KTI12
MQRQIALDTVLIVDGLNYIKGFRYQMYCAAREMKLRVCTVSFFLRDTCHESEPAQQKLYVVATQEQCTEWNKNREDGKKYAPET